MKQIKYAFLDRDGTLLFEPQDTYQIDSVKQLRILDGVIDGLKKLIEKGYSLIMVTNQDGLGTRDYPRSSFQAVQKKFLAVCKQNGITFKKIFFCPHLPSEECDCRKPKLGLVRAMVTNQTIDKLSFVCGNRENDKLFAKNMDLRFIPMQTNTNFYTALSAEGVI